MDWKFVPSILYSKVPPNGAVTTIVPVGTAHVGCTVALAVGATGGVGTASIVTVDAASVVQVLSVILLTVNVYVFGDKPAKIALAWKAPPTLYSTPA